MFETKKHLQEQLNFALGRCFGHEKSDALFKSIYEINQKQIDRLLNRINDLLAANEKLKRDLDIESSQKEEFAELLAAAEKDAHCPEDCKNRNQQNMCRTCTRYPNAKDKYEVES